MNPEFQRNLWLEASPRRVAWAAVTIVLVLFAAIMVGRSGTHQAEILGGVGLAIFVACAVLWAGRLAGGAVLAEVAARTWDFQRLSALSAWQMTWGKLFGVTALAASAGLVGLLVYLAVGQPPDAGWQIALALGVAVLVQAGSFMAALVAVRKARAEGRQARTGGVLGGLFMGYLLLSGFISSRAFSGGGARNLLNLFGGSADMIRWWSLPLPGDVFRALSVACFAGFALAGAWRLMRLELQMRNEPVVWPLFLVFLAAWVAGLPQGAPGQVSAWAGLSVAGLAMCLAAYAAAFVEPADRVTLRRFGRLVSGGDAAEAARIAPAALFPLAFAAILTLASVGAPDTGAVLRGSALGGTAHSGALLAFLVRDLGVIALFRFGPRPQRGDFGAVVALALLYGVGGIIGSTSGGAAGAAVFLPTGGAFVGVSVLSALAQAVVAWMLAVRRIRAPESSVSAPPSGPASAPVS